MHQGLLSTVMSFFYNHISWCSGKYLQDSQTSQIEANLQKFIKI